MSFPPFVSRPSAPVAIVALVAVLATGGCSGGTTASASVATSPMAVASPAGAAIAGWPLPGQATTTSFIPILASAQNVVGRSRFLLTLVDRDNRPIASPDRAVTLKVFDLAKDPASPTET